MKMHSNRFLTQCVRPFFWLFGAILIAGCAPNVPDCSDDTIINLVKEIAGENSPDLSYIFTSANGDLNFELKAIRTLSTNDETGANSCAAELITSGDRSDNFATTMIEYTVEITDNGEDYYVSVFGLDGWSIN